MFISVLASLQGSIYFCRNVYHVLLQSRLSFDSAARSIVRAHPNTNATHNLLS